jgi:hypothetical protein
MADNSIKEIVKEHLGVIELSKTQNTLLGTMEKFTEANKELSHQRISEKNELNFDGYARGGQNITITYESGGRYKP